MPVKLWIRLCKITFTKLCCSLFTQDRVILCEDSYCTGLQVFCWNDWMNRSLLSDPCTQMDRCNGGNVSCYNCFLLSGVLVLRGGASFPSQTHVLFLPACVARVPSEPLVTQWKRSRCFTHKCYVADTFVMDTFGWGSQKSGWGEFTVIRTSCSGLVIWSSAAWNGPCSLPQSPVKVFKLCSCD